MSRTQASHRAALLDEDVVALTTPQDETTFQIERLGSRPRRSPRTTARYTFTAAEIMELLQRWTRTYGEPPCAIDLEPARARRLGQGWRAERFESGQWPSARMVVTQFGSFTAALSASGITARRAPVRAAPNLTGPRAVTDAIRAWVRLYGEVPTLADWDPARARRLRQDWRIARYNSGDWPSTRTVHTRFGSMSRAIEAAGLQPRAVGSHGSSRSDERRSSRHGLVEALASAYAERTPSPEPLTSAIRALAHARQAEDPTAIHSSLIEIAARALAWADNAGSDGRDARGTGSAAS